MRAEAAVRTVAALLRAYQHASWLEGMAVRAQWWRWRFFIASRSTPQMHLSSIRFVAGCAAENLTCAPLGL